MSDYEGKASIVSSAGDPFATGDLVAEGTDDGWTGTLSDLLWRTQMVPQPLNDTEWVRLDEIEGQPVVEVAVENVDKAARLTCAETLPS